jgi:hypothetical protein
MACGFVLWNEVVSMGFLGSLRKGFGFFLNSMGVSTYAKKPKPAAVVTGPVEPTVGPAKVD